MPVLTRQKAVSPVRTHFPFTEMKVVLLQLLPLERLSLRMPLALTIEYTARNVIASNIDFELFGYGDTESEAIRDFARSLEELYFWLKKNKKKLSKNLKSKYEFLTKIVSGK